MNLSKILLTVILLSIICFRISAQSAQKDQVPYWYVTYYKIPFAKIDSLKQLTATYGDRMLAEAKKTGDILEQKIFIHHTGGEYNVVVMLKRPSWQHLEKDVDWAKLMEKIEPDPAKRDAVFKAYQWVFEGSDIHKDEIYKEVKDW